MSKTGIYQIKSEIKPEKIYIGSAINIKERWRHHISNLRRNKHPNKKLQRHFNKYGESDLVFSVLTICDKCELINTEQYFIDFYNPIFNFCKRAYSRIGTKQSKKTRLKISKALTGRKRPPYTELAIINMRNGAKRRGPLSDEIKEKIRKTKTGQKRNRVSPEGCQNMVNAWKIRKLKKAV